MHPPLCPKKAFNSSNILWPYSASDPLFFTLYSFISQITTNDAWGQKNQIIFEKSYIVYSNKISFRKCVSIFSYTFCVLCCVFLQIISTFYSFCSFIRLFILNFLLLTMWFFCCNLCAIRVISLSRAVHLILRNSNFLSFNSIYPLFEFYR